MHHLTHKLAQYSVTSIANLSNQVNLYKAAK